MPTIRPGNGSLQLYGPNTPLPNGYEIAVTSTEDTVLLFEMDGCTHLKILDRPFSPRSGSKVVYCFETTDKSHGVRRPTSGHKLSPPATKPQQGPVDYESMHGTAVLDYAVVQDSGSNMELSLDVSTQLQEVIYEDTHTSKPRIDHGSLFYTITDSHRDRVTYFVWFRNKVIHSTRVTTSSRSDSKNGAFAPERALVSTQPHTPHPFKYDPSTMCAPSSSSSSSSSALAWTATLLDCATHICQSVEGHLRTKFDAFSLITRFCGLTGYTNPIPSSWQSAGSHVSLTLPRLWQALTENSDSHTGLATAQKRNQGIQFLRVSPMQLCSQDLIKTLVWHWAATLRHRDNMTHPDEASRNLSTLVKGLRIDVVRNESAYLAFLAYFLRILDETRDEPANMIVAYHGTNTVTSEAIGKRGFRMDFADTPGNVHMYGSGLYVATDSKNSHHYTANDSNGWRTMFICFCIPGRSTQGNSGMTRPPKQSQGEAKGLMYNSTRNADGSYICVFNDAAILPVLRIGYQGAT